MRSTPHRLAPFLDWIREINSKILQRDALAGLTVSVVLIPQAMAYAMLTGLPPIYGLYAAAITPLIAAFWGSLRQLSTGPIAIMSLLVFTTLSPLARPGSPEFIELVFLLSLMIGIFYLLIGFFGMGMIMSFISHSTVKGFTASAALIIISTQLPHLFGISVSHNEYLIQSLYELIIKLPEVHLPTLGIGVAAFVVIHGIKKYRPNFPAALVALTGLTFIVHFFSLDQIGIAVIGEIPPGLPNFHFPNLDIEVGTALFGSALVIALVSFAETYSVGKAISEKTKQKIDVNQEFIGQGLANVVGSFFQCPPVSGSFSRTAMNFSAGGKTGISSAVSSVIVVLTLLFLTPLFSSVPKAALAALVISAVMLLFHPREVFSLWKKNRHDGIVAVTVFSLALLIKPDYALLIGVIISLVLFLWKSMHPRIVRFTWDPKNHIYTNAETHDTQCCEQITILRIDNSIYFANAEYTIEHILKMVDQSSEKTQYLLLDFKAVGFIDITGIFELQRLIDELKTRGIKMQIISPHLPIREVFVSSGFLEKLGDDAIFSSYADAMEILKKHLDHSDCKHRCPYSCPTESAKNSAPESP